MYFIFTNPITKALCTTGNKCLLLYKNQLLYISFITELQKRYLDFVSNRTLQLGMNYLSKFYAPLYKTDGHFREGPAQGHKDEGNGASIMRKEWESWNCSAQRKEGSGRFYQCI